MIEASSDIAVSSKKDFEKIKSKDWYKELWEIVAFSKDGEVRNARGVDDLDDLYDITAKAVIVFSEQDVKNAMLIKEHKEIVDALCKKINKKQYPLINELYRVKYGIERFVSIESLDKNQRLFVVMAVLLAANEDTQGDMPPLAQKYLQAVLKAAECDLSDVLNKIDQNQDFKESFTDSELHLMYNWVMRFVYIANNSFDTTVIGLRDDPQKAKDIQSWIADVSELAGKKAPPYGIDSIEKIYEIDGNRINLVDSDIRDNNRSDIRFDCEYNSDYDCYAIIGCSNCSEIVIFPSVVDGHKIEAIGEDVFFLSDDKVEEIEISEGIKIIDYQAFRFCENIDTVKLPNSLKELHKFAFEECYSLTSIAIPDSVEFIEVGAFRRCENLKKITYKGNTYSFDTIKSLYSLFPQEDWDESYGDEENDM